jgi:peptidoglycan/xylan/chitin deacetylase (PgdA/CDA1 family)
MRGVKRQMCESVSKIHPGRDKKFIVILMYHGVTDSTTRDWGPAKYDVNKSLFKSQLKHLSEDFAPISIDDLNKWLRGDIDIPDKSFLVTFDDGLQNQFTNALPILESLNIPATMYIPTAAITNESSLFERVLVDTLDEIGIRDSAALYRKLYDTLRYESRDTRLAIIEEMSPNSEKLSLHLTRKQLQKLNAHPLISIGSHSHAHTLLTEHSNINLKEDIRLSKQKLKNIISSEVNHFSYPFGNFNTSVKKAVASEGFSTAVTTRPRHIKYRQCENQYLIPRIDGATQFKEYFGNGR